MNSLLAIHLFFTLARIFPQWLELDHKLSNDLVELGSLCRTFFKPHFMNVVQRYNNETVPLCLKELMALPSINS